MKLFCICAGTKLQTPCWACLGASAALNTLRGGADPLRRKVYRAGFLTCHAGNAGFLVPADLYQAEAVEPAVNGTQRAQVLAEWAVYFYR